LGLDAIVYCTCYRDGRCPKPPVAEHLISLDEDGGLQCVTEHELPEDVRQALWTWMDTACEHEAGAFHEWIGNSAVRGWVRHVLKTAAGTGNPLLARLFTDEEFRGRVPAALAPQIVDELRGLRGRDVIGSTRVILDGDGNMICDEIDVYGECDPSGVRILTPGRAYQSPWDDIIEIAIDGFEFVLRDRTDPTRELMRTRDLGQRRDDAGLVPGHPVDVTANPTYRFTYTDREGGRTITVRTHGISRGLPWPSGTYYDRSAGPDGYLHYFPNSVFVSERAVMVVEGAGVFAALTRIFEASVRTGNAVVWCSKPPAWA
jgi:hypothetical protein